uniref:Uncharacterized protein n=1 Tax=viral metagenome TaxID=1070528 RepID=A0A6C0EII3_9ZZZZ
MDSISTYESTYERTYESSYKSYGYNKDPAFFETVKIKATHQKQYLKLNYTYTTIDKMESCHPFHGQTPQFTNYKDGCIVRYSTMVQKMLDFLLMDDSELLNHIGNTYPDDYRRGIIFSFIHLKVREKDDIINISNWVSYDKRLILNFYGDQPKNTGVYCQVNALISYMTYEDGNKFASVEYQYTYNGFVDSVHNIPKMNPFYNQGSIQEHVDGDIVRCNPMIKAMLDTLSINDLEFKHSEGYEYPKCYRNGIILSISHFWD